MKRRAQWVTIDPDRFDVFFWLDERLAIDHVRTCGGYIHPIEKVDSTEERRYAQELLESVD